MPVSYDGHNLLLSFSSVEEADGRFVSFCEELGLATCAGTRAGAEERLARTVRHVLELAAERGDLDAYLAGRGLLG